MTTCKMRARSSMVDKHAGAKVCMVLARSCQDEITVRLGGAPVPCYAATHACEDDDCSPMSCYTETRAQPRATVPGPGHGPKRSPAYIMRVLRLPAWVNYDSLACVFSIIAGNLARLSNSRNYFAQQNKIRTHSPSLNETDGESYSHL